MLRNEAEPPADNVSYSFAPIVRRAVMSPADFDWTNDDPPTATDDEAIDE